VSRHNCGYSSPFSSHRGVIDGNHVQGA
jgi:hypothetical protein